MIVYVSVIDFLLLKIKKILFCLSLIICLSLSIGV